MDELHRLTDVDVLAVSSIESEKIVDEGAVGEALAILDSRGVGEIVVTAANQSKIGKEIFGPRQNVLHLSSYRGFATALLFLAAAAPVGECIEARFGGIRGSWGITSEEPRPRRRWLNTMIRVSFKGGSHNFFHAHRSSLNQRRPPPQNLLEIFSIPATLGRSAHIPM